MGIKDELHAELTDAMRSHDRNRIDVVRQITTEVARAVKAANFDGEENDELYLKVITSYAKKMGKAVAEYSRLEQGDSGAAVKLKFEVEYLGRWLPKPLSEDELVALVDAAIQDVGASDMKGLGQVIGYLKKRHPEIDGATASRLAKTRLSAP